MPDAWMTPAVRAFLEEPRFAVVCTLNRDGSPQMTVLWYEFQEDRVLMNAERHRQKIYNLRRDPRISFVIEDAYRYMRLSGRAVLIDDQTIAQRDVERLAIRYCGETEGRRLVESEYAHEERVTIAMTIDHVHLFGFRRHTL